MFLFGELSSPKLATRIVTGLLSNARHPGRALTSERLAHRTDRRIECFEGTRAAGLKR